MTEEDAVFFAHSENRVGHRHALKAHLLTSSAKQAATQVWEGLPVGLELTGFTGVRRRSKKRHTAWIVERGIEVNGHIRASLSAGAHAAVVSAGRTGQRSGFDFWMVADAKGRMITVREFKRRSPRRH